MGLSVNLSDPVRIEPGAQRGQLQYIEQILCRVSANDQAVEYQDILVNLQADVFPIFITRDGRRNQGQIEQFLQDAYGLWVYPQDARERTAVDTVRNLHCVVRR